MSRMIEYEPRKKPAKAKRARKPSGKVGPLYRVVWRLIDGAIRDALHHHPEYLSPKGARGGVARVSINKRVAGVVTSFIEQSMKGLAAQQRSGRQAVSCSHEPPRNAGVSARVRPEGTR